MSQEQKLKIKLFPLFCVRVKLRKYYIYEGNVKHCRWVTAAVVLKIVLSMLVVIFVTWLRSIEESEKKKNRKMINKVSSKNIKAESDLNLGFNQNVYKQDDAVRCQRTYVNCWLSFTDIPTSDYVTTAVCLISGGCKATWVEWSKYRTKEKERNRLRGYKITKAEKEETESNLEKESKGEWNQVKGGNSRMAPVSGGPPQWNTNCSDRLMSQCLFKWQLVRPAALRWAADLSGLSPH